MVAVGLALDDRFPWVTGSKSDVSLGSGACIGGTCETGWTGGTGRIDWTGDDGGTGDTGGNVGNVAFDGICGYCGDCGSDCAGNGGNVGQDTFDEIVVVLNGSAVTEIVANIATATARLIDPRIIGGGASVWACVAYFVEFQRLVEL